MEEKTETGYGNGNGMKGKESNSFPLLGVFSLNFFTFDHQR